MTIAEKLRMEGRIEGRMEGRTEGWTKGILVGQIQALERVLKRTPSRPETLEEMSLESLQAMRVRLEREFDQQ